MAKSIKEEMERLKQDVIASTPKFDITDDMVKPDNLIPPIKLAPPVDYEKLLLDENCDSRTVVIALIKSTIGEDWLNDPWVLSKIDIDCDKIARVHQLIKTLQKRLNQISANIDLMPEEASWYMIFNNTNKEQRENIKMFLSLLKEFEGYYREYQKSKVGTSDEKTDSSEIYIQDFKELANVIANEKKKLKEAARDGK